MVSRWGNLNQQKVVFIEPMISDCLGKPSLKAELRPLDMPSLSVCFAVYSPRIGERSRSGR